MRGSEVMCSKKKCVAPGLSSQIYGNQNTEVRNTYISPKVDLVLANDLDGDGHVVKASHAPENNAKAARAYLLLDLVQLDIAARLDGTHRRVRG